jgi:hypothetical protein
MQIAMGLRDIVVVIRFHSKKQNEGRKIRKVGIMKNVTDNRRH